MYIMYFGLLFSLPIYLCISVFVYVQLRVCVRVCKPEDSSECSSSGTLALFVHAGIIYFIYLLQGRVLLHSLGWLRTLDHLASAPSVLGLLLCTATLCFFN